MSIDPILAGLDASESFLTQLDQLIKSQILGAWPDAIPGIDPIARALDGLVASAETVLQNVENEIKTQIEPLIQNAIPNALDFLNSLTSSIDTHLSQLIGNIATTEDVLGSAISVLKGHAPELAGWLYENVTGGFGNIALGVLKTIENENPEAIDPLLDELLKIPHLPPFMHSAVLSARERRAPFFAFLLPALILASLLPVLGAVSRPIAQVAEQDSWNAIPTKVADPATLVEAFQRGMISLDRYHQEIRKSGYDTEPADWIRGNQRQMLDPNTLTRAYIRGEIDRSFWEENMSKRGIDTEQARIAWTTQLELLPENDVREAFLRGFFNEKQHDDALAQIGYKQERAALKRQLYFYIPPPQDLIHMAIRNVFNPEIVQRFQLFGDFPEPFKVAAANQGISELWAQRYWGAHWIVPGNEEAFQMFQRTTDEPLDDNADAITLSDGSIVHNIIGASTLKLLLREKDIAPFYRDKLTQLAYRPITRIDIRRLESVGLLNDAQVERAYLDLGYSQKHARQLAEFTKKLNARAKKDEATSLVDNLRRQALRLYVQGKMNDDEVDSTLHDLSFTDAEIEVFKAEALLVARAERVSRIEARIGKLYVAGLIDATDAEKRLRDHDLPTGAITQLFSEWDLDIEYRGGSEHIHKHRDLTRVEILEAMTDGMLDDATAATMLQDIGYDADGAQAEIGLALFKQQKATKRTQIDAIKASYINGVIELLDASNRLDALHVAGDQRDAYLAEWTLQRETRTERIPLATLRDMARGNYIDQDTLFLHLKRHRYTDADASLLIQFWFNQPIKKGLVNA